MTPARPPSTSRSSVRAPRQRLCFAQGLRAGISSVVVHRPAYCSRACQKRPHVGGVVVPPGGIEERSPRKEVPPRAVLPVPSAAVRERRARTGSGETASTEGDAGPQARASAQPEFFRNLAAGVQAATNRFAPPVGDLPRCDVFVAGYAVRALHVACWSAKPTVAATGGRQALKACGTKAPPVSGGELIVKAYCRGSDRLLILPTTPRREGAGGDGNVSPPRLLL